MTRKTKPFSGPEASRRLGCALVLLLAPLFGAAAQVSVLEPDGEFQSFPQQEFMTIRGEHAVVGFLPGALDRAHHVLRRLDNLGGFFSRWFDDRPIPLAAYVVDREQWEEIGLPGLYGLPLRTGPTSVFVPASGDEESVRMWRSALGVDSLPMVPGMPVTGTPEQAAALALADVLAQLEASRSFAVHAGLQGRDGWIQEVASHVGALVAFRQTEPDRLPEISDMFARLRERMGGARRHDDEHFSHLLQQGEEPEVQAWLWYQGVFFAAAEIVVEADGRRATHKLLKLRGDEALTRDRLVGRYPELAAWHERWFRPDTGEPELSPAAPEG